LPAHAGGSMDEPGGVGAPVEQPATSSAAVTNATRNP
jgi:hypothetical protein